jgi:hypothetical protein
MPLKPLPKPPKPGTSPAPRPSARPAKTFEIAQWDGSTSGEKIILSGELGKGKTSLAAMAPDPVVFIGLDDGGRKIRHPKTGKRLDYIPGVETFEDVRDALDACVNLDCQTVVVDTGTELQRWAEAFVLRTIKVSNNQNVATKPALHLEDYGWGKGYKHLWDAMRLPLLNCDRVVAAGKNVIVITQSMCHKCNNDFGEEYLKEGPALYHSEKNWSVMKLWCEWADHIFRIRHQQTKVPDGKKKASGDDTLVIDTKGNQTFYAKSRTLDDPVIAFSTKDDDSLWQLLFEGE